MLKWSLAGSTALTLILMMSGAQAQVTAEEVWKSWQDMSKSVGQTVTSTSEARSGDSLVVEGVKMSMDNGQGLLASSDIGTLKFRDTGSGTVEVTMPDSYAMSMTIPPEDPSYPEGATSMKLTISQPGMLITAGGSATETSYDFTAPKVDIALTEVATATGPKDVKFEVAMTGMAGKYMMGGDAAAKTLDSSFSAATAAINAVGTDAGTTFVANFAMADLAGTTKGNFLGADMMANMATALNAGFATDGGISYGKTIFDMDVTESGSNTKVSGAMDGGNINFGLDKTRLSYAIGMKTANFLVSGSDIPFPQVNVSYGEFAFNLLMPVSKSDTPQDFSYLTKIIDLKVSDELWAMFDPTGNLPRDPATLIIDTKGTGKLAADIMDPASAEAMANAVPGELNSLDVTEVRAKVAGAEVSGTGAFTFDNTDLVTFGGMPVPTGKLDVKMTGINALLDTLVSMGFIPEDQIMGARMMLAMFAKPGDGPDSLVSTLEFKDKGFFANGQRLQ